MGQKINPLGFRLGTPQSHRSRWFAQPKNYSQNLQEDEKLRDYIKNYVQKKFKISSVVEGITRIEIKKEFYVTYILNIKIYTASITLFKENGPQELKELRMNLEKDFYCVNRKIKLAIKRITEPYRYPNIVAEFIAYQLKRRVPYRKAMRMAVELTEEANTKGVRVQMAGRLGGKDIARVDWIQEGRLPLQTVQAKIDYCSYTVRTILGVLGIKIWIFIDGE
uniref:Small ribosomal subunit protein uS3c n=1 Tax=Cyphia belfastica TaxID=2041114 RepID=A0A291F308_9ASTR|nr:ribosomal protein S3 [Cyphia belfastica]ATG26497.1 ribosomal protein S3 [Cyphia belfastica]